MAQLVNDAGTTVFEGQILNGGSQPERVAVSIAFDTPDLVLTGIEVTTLAPGDVVAGTGASFVSVATAWDGTTPAIYLGIEPENAAIGGGSLADANSGVGPGTPPEIVWPKLSDTNSFFNAPVFLCGTATPVIATVSDGAGGDPGSLQGAGEIVLSIFRAAS